MNFENLVTVKDAATRLGYTTANITRIIRSGELKAIKRGRKYFIRVEDLNEYAFVGGEKDGFFV